MKTSHSVILNLLNEQKVKENHKRHRIYIILRLSVCAGWDLGCFKLRLLAWRLFDSPSEVLQWWILPVSRHHGDLPPSIIPDHHELFQPSLTSSTAGQHPPAQGSGTEPPTFSQSVRLYTGVTLSMVGSRCDTNSSYHVGEKEENYYPLNITQIWRAQ